MSCTVLTHKGWSVCRLRNSPHEELLAAATEQMKITELRLRKLVATQERGEAQKPSATATAERRAGLVYNHLMGAHTICEMQQKQTKRRAWYNTWKWNLQPYS